MSSLDQLICIDVYTIISNLTFFLSSHSSLDNGSAIADCVKDKLIDLTVVSNFIPGMACQWEMIGIQLRQQELVQSLKQPNLDAKSNLMQILQVAMESGGHPLTYGTLLAALRSRAVNLSQVATELRQAAVDSVREQELVQQATNGDQPPSRYSPPSTPTDVTEATGLLTHAGSYA